MVLLLTISMVITHMNSTVQSLGFKNLPVTMSLNTEGIRPKEFEMMSKVKKSSFLVSSTQILIR